MESAKDYKKSLTPMMEKESSLNSNSELTMNKINSRPDSID